MEHAPTPSKIEGIVDILFACNALEVWHILAEAPWPADENPITDVDWAELIAGRRTARDLMEWVNTKVKIVDSDEEVVNVTDEMCWPILVRCLKTLYNAISARSSVRKRTGRWTDEQLLKIIKELYPPKEPSVKVFWTLWDAERGKSYAWDPPADYRVESVTHQRSEGLQASLPPVRT